MKRAFIAALLALSACGQPATPVSNDQVTGLNFEWQLSAADSQVRLPVGVNLLDIDGFEATAKTVSAVKAKGAEVVCYIDVGSWEPGRPDSAAYPAYLKVQRDPNWPDEWFLDITDVFKQDSALAAILNKRFDMCVNKGFTWLEPDNMQNDENVTKRRFTRQQQLDFNIWVADLAHSKGLKILQKNGPDQVPQSNSQGRRMLDVYDGILNEECQQFKECANLGLYAKQGKPAINVEYRKRVALDCAQYNKLGVFAMKRDLNLSAPGMRGYRREVCK